MNPRPPPAEVPEHHRELARMGTFALVFFALLLLPYASPSMAALRPWLPGEPLPLVGLLQTQVIETDAGTLEQERLQTSISEEEEEEAPPSPPSGEEEAAEEVFSLDSDPLWPPGHAAPLEVPMGALDAYFEALAAVGDGEPGRVVRALVWGDSIIAADQVIGDIRARMQARFGDGGLGFLPVQIDPYWSVRGDIARATTGTWVNQTIVSGDAPDARYGLAGVASTATTAASASLAALSGKGEGEGEGEGAPIHRVQLFFQRQPGGGSFSASIQGDGLRTGTAAERRSDGVAELRSAEGARRLSVRTGGEGPVTFYGAALESRGPGVTWETFGIAGSHISAMNHQGRSHLRQQVAARAPSLLVYWTGGNELGYPDVQRGDGSVYQRIYRRVIHKLREGAPEASCLLIGPIDQATRSRGRIQSKPNIARLVALQRAVAREEGCVYWDAHAAMGGEGAFLRWLRHDPPLALPDLMHISREGGTVLGDLLADALLVSYDLWRQAHPDAGWLPPESSP